MLKRHKTFKFLSILLLIAFFFIWKPVIDGTAQPSYQECTYLGKDVCVNNGQVVNNEKLLQSDYEYNSTVKYVEKTTLEKAILFSVTLLLIYFVLLAIRYAFFPDIIGEVSFLALFSFFN